MSQTRLHAQELARRKALGKNTDPACGITPAPVNAVDVPLEKMLDRYAMPRNHAELPVHGMELLGKGLASGKNGSSRMGSPGVSGSLSPVTPVSPLGGSGLASRGVSPVGGIALDSIVGMALGEKKESLGGFRSSSPARRVGGVKPPVELGPAPSRE